MNFIGTRTNPVRTKADSRQMYWLYWLYWTLSIICRTMESAWVQNTDCAAAQGQRTDHIMSHHVTSCHVMDSGPIPSWGSWAWAASIPSSPGKGHLLRLFWKKRSTANSTQKWLNWETNDCWHLHVWSFFDTLKHLKRKEDLGLVWISWQLGLQSMC